MVNISFYLNNQKTNKAGENPVYMLITFNGNRIRKAVKGVKSKPISWNSNKGRIKKSLAYQDSEVIDLHNADLASLEETVQRIDKEVLRNKSLLNEEFILSSLENPDLIGTTEEKFFEITEKFLKVNDSVKAKNTIKGYKTVFNFIKEFEKHRKTKIKFDSIDLTFFESFRSYAFNYKEKSNNYFSKIIAVLKNFMNWSYDHGYHKNQNHRKFKAPENETEVIYLTLDELMTLLNTKFKKKRLEHVKDTFCFACFTGLRFSDIMQLKPGHIKNDHLIKVIQKTGEVNNKIPLNPFSKQILEKYIDTIYYPLPKVSNQKYNEYIKECCEIAKIDTPTIKTRQSGSKRTEEIVPKWKLITSHIARKTFITVSLILGMNERVVKNISGHKKDEHFRKYVKIAEDFKKSEMDKTWGRIYEK